MYKRNVQKLTMSIILRRAICADINMSDVQWEVGTVDKFTQNKYLNKYINT